MPSAGLRRESAAQLCDWIGQPLPSTYVSSLMPGCIARVCITNTELGSSEGLYFRIIRIKDGTFWGITQGTYRTMGDTVGLSDGDIMTFRKEHIYEIPLGKLWQPKRYTKQVQGLTPSNTVEL